MQTNEVKRVVVAQDLSGVGRCALSVAMPVLSVMGLQACPLPTAVLSTHTGGFGKRAVSVLTDYLKRAVSHYAESAIRFDGFLSGYLAEPAQTDIIRQFLLEQRKTGDITAVVDPAMGDNGKLYSGIAPEMPKSMLLLCSDADVITPNLTEACLLTGTPMFSAPLCEAQVRGLLQKLFDACCRSVLITSVPVKGRGMCNVCATAGEEGFWYCAYQPIEASYPGTGDLFASVLCGALLGGNMLSDAMAKATGFVYRCVRRTAETDTPPREGVCFETELISLSQKETRFVSRYLF